MRTVKLIGSAYGKLTVLSRDGGYKNATWKCRCDCGKETVVSTCHLRSGHTTSCGCNKVGSPSHGKSKTRTHRSWKELRQRCLNLKSSKAKWCSMRGITIAPEWNNYEVFLMDMGERPEGTSIDRINPDWGYYPENCRWATPQMQAETNRGCFR